MELKDFNYNWPMYLANRASEYKRNRISKEEMLAVIQQAIKCVHLPSLKTELHLRWSKDHIDDPDQVELLLHTVAWDMDHCLFYS